MTNDPDPEKFERRSELPPDEVEATVDELVAWLSAPPEKRSSAHDDMGGEPPPPSENDPSRAAPGAKEHRLPDGVPHIPGFLFARIQVQRLKKGPADYMVAAHHMFNYLGILNGIPEDGYEIIGSVHEVPEVGYDIVTVVCLMNCDFEPLDFDAFLRWAAHFIEGESYGQDESEFHEPPPEDDRPQIGGMDV